MVRRFQNGSQVVWSFQIGSAQMIMRSCCLIASVRGESAAEIARHWLRHSAAQVVGDAAAAAALPGL